jgi:hypothetical protein
MALLIAFRPLYDSRPNDILKRTGRIFSVPLTFNQTISSIKVRR